MRYVLDIWYIFSYCVCAFCEILRFPISYKYIKIRNLRVLLFTYNLRILNNVIHGDLIVDTRNTLIISSKVYD